MDAWGFWIVGALVVFSTSSLVMAGIYILLPRLFNRWVDNVIHLLFTEPYSSNLWEGVTAVRHSGWQVLVENELRASSEEPLSKPVGSQRQFPHLDGLQLSPAQLFTLPVEETEPVELTTVLGKQAERPLEISMPVLSSGMGYAVGLSKPYSLAIAKGTGMAKTAFNSGEGPVLPEHRELAHRLVVQVHSGQWSPDEDVLQLADMVEIHIGQGSSAGVGSYLRKDRYPAEILEALGFDPYDRQGVYYKPGRMKGVESPKDLKRLVDKLRKQSRGAPISIKLAANAVLEKELEIAVEAGVDVVVLDGAQAGTHSSPAILVDDFGLPTLNALVRAVRYIEENNLSDKIDLIVSGGIQTPGDVLKTLALGASAVYMGTTILYAAMHDQIVNTLPYEPPTQMAWSNGTLTDLYDQEKGAQSVARFLNNFAEELKIGVRALGKRSIKELNRGDLLAWDPDVSRITGVPMG